MGSMHCAAELAGITVLGTEAQGAEGVVINLSSDVSGLDITCAMERAPHAGGLHWRRAERVCAQLCSRRIRVRIVLVNRQATPLVDTDLDFFELVRVYGNVDELRSTASRGMARGAEEDPAGAAQGRAPLVIFHGQDGALWLSRQTVCTLLASGVIWPISRRCSRVSAAPSAGEPAVAPAAEDPMRPDSLGSSLGASTVQPYGAAASRTTLTQLAQALERLRLAGAERERASAELHGVLLARRAIEEARTSLDQRAARLQALTAAVEASEAQLAASREALAAEARALVTRRARLEEAVRSLSVAPSRAMSPSAGGLPEPRPSPEPSAQQPCASLLDLRQSIQLRRATMLMQLFQIFVVRVSSDGRSGKTHTINHLRTTPLAESAGSDDEENAAALGLVAHCVQAAARILLVSLRHPLDLCTSRSHIIDRTVHTAQARLPLFAKGADPAAYRRAQRLLARDIEQLLDAVGLPHSASGELLPSLEVLISRVRKSPLSIQPW